MNKLDILKGASEILTSIGVSAIVGNVIKLTADPAAGKIKKAAIGFGGFVLSSMIADKAVDYANERIDGTAERLGKIFKPAGEEVDDIFSEEDVVMFPDGQVFVDGTPIDHPTLDGLENTTQKAPKKEKSK